MTKLSRALVALAVVAGLAALAAPAPASAGSSRPLDRARLQHELDRLVAAGAPGVVALVLDGDRTWTLTSGYANVATHARMRARDRFRIGGVTKSFVCTVILQLVGEGKLTLDDTVEQWLPDRSPTARPSRSECCSSTPVACSTIPKTSSSSSRPFRIPRIAGGLAAWLAVALRHRPLFAPGTRWSYSNTGYIVLGLIVEGATGKKLANQIRDRILGRLNCTPRHSQSKHACAGPTPTAISCSASLLRWTPACGVQASPAPQALPP